MTCLCNTLGQLTIFFCFREAWGERRFSDVHVLGTVHKHVWHSVLAQTTPPRAGGRVKNFHENERLPSTLPAKMAAEGERDHKFVNKQ